MQITSLQLVNFKRFTDLSIEAIPSDTRLVLLIGSNGSGKSSVFDAFECLNKINKDGTSPSMLSYYRKNNEQTFYIDLRTSQGFQVLLQDFKPQGIEFPSPAYAFYGRTSFRQLPRLQRTSLGQSGSVNVEKDSDRPRFFIDRDERLENDIEKITVDILRSVFTSFDSKEKIQKQILEPLNGALERVFGHQNGTKLTLVEFIPPAEGKVAEINFQKGSSRFHYNQLSAGEKEVFNIILNLIARREHYQDTIYFFDELDLHLNTSIQYNLLREITENWIPESCQLWTASHSLGFIQYARDYEHGAILDFDDLDFDHPVTLVPQPKDNPDIYEIAVGRRFIPYLFEHLEVWFVENKDDELFAEAGIPKTIFIPENGRNGVYHKAKTGQFNGLVDRDFLSDEDIELIEKQYNKLKILRYYSIENYLYHPDNLKEYYEAKGHAFDREQYIHDLATAKNAEKAGFLLSISLKRTEYPYFGEPSWNGKAEQNRFKNKDENFVQTKTIAGYLESDRFEDFYKVLPMKTYCTQLPQRQHIPKSGLARTAWFKAQISSLLQ